MKILILFLAFCSNAFAGGWSTDTAINPMTQNSESVRMARSEPEPLEDLNAGKIVKAHLQVFKNDTIIHITGARMGCTRLCPIQMAFNGADRQAFTMDLLANTGGMLYVLNWNYRFRSGIKDISRMILILPIQDSLPVTFEFEQLGMSAFQPF